MLRSRVIIEITPSRLELVVVRSGRAAAVRFERFTPEAAETPFPEWLEARLETLAKWTRELGLAGSSATVAYWAGTGGCGVFSCPMGAGDAGADQSARLAVSELAGLHQGVTISDVQRIATDPANSRSKQPQTHTLAAIDRQEVAVALVEWAARAGLTVEHVAPLSAGPLVQSVRAVMAASTEHGAAAQLWFDEHFAVLAAATGGRLALVRTISIGTEAIVDALCRSIHAGGEHPVTLDRTDVRRLLAQAGLPAPDDVFDSQSGVTGRAVLPLVQPVLQRLVVEIKQSLRFSLTDGERSAAQVRLVGPGGSIRRLSEMLGSQCGAQVSAEPSSTAGNDGASAARGSLTAWFSPNIDLSLLPPEIVRTGTFRRVRRGAWAGMGVAAALLALGAGLDFLKLADLKQVQASLESRATDLARAASEHTAAAAARDRALAMQTRASTLLGESTAWSALLGAVAEATPSTIRLTNIDQVSDDTGLTCRITGTARVEGDTTLADVIARYNRDLAAIPLVSGVRMGSTSRTKASGHDAYRFDITLSLRPVSAAAMRAVAAGSQP